MLSMLCMGGGGGKRRGVAIVSWEEKKENDYF